MRHRQPASACLCDLCRRLHWWLLYVPAGQHTRGRTWQWAQPPPTRDEQGTGPARVSVPLAVCCCGRGERLK